MNSNSIVEAFGRLLKNGLGIPLLLLALLAMIVIPMPPIMLDIFFTFNISLALVVMLASIYIHRPLDFSVFPTVLLITTLLRLSLNIASTRVVLLEGHTGTAAAGQVIQSFGEFVVGGNYAVGFVIFAILVIINFVVVTKGAGRISEVSARFTLDAMPGKQMAVDADLNAGLLTQEEANHRRLEIINEADFYGSMDGASKFIRGDAIAGIIIMLITIIGGLAVGMLQHDMGIGDATRNYTLLTIGDGLVAQIPSLILSTAAGIIVTRVSKEQELGDQVLSQMFSSPKALITTAGIMGIIGLIPGMPNFAFLTFAAIAGIGGYMLNKKQSQPKVVVEETPPPEPTTEPKELGWDDVTPVDIIGLEVGYRLIPLVDKNQGGQLMNRIKGVRKKLSQELGFLVPAVHIRDNLDLSPNAYRITLMGVAIGDAEIHPDRELAINPGQVFGSVSGIEGKDPAFGLDAVWIETSQHDQAQSLGYTVVDASTVIATHLSEILQNHAHELIGREEVQHLLDKLAKESPKLIEELIPNALPLGVVVKVLQNLLEEKIPIKDIRTIAESLADNASNSQDPDILTGLVRVALGRAIVQKINGMALELPVMTLDSSLEQILHQSIQKSVQSGSNEMAGFEPGLAERLLKALQEQTQRQEIAGQAAVLVVSAQLRSYMSRFVRHAIPGLNVLSFNEIPNNKQIKIIANIGGNAIAA